MMNKICMEKTTNLDKIKMRKETKKMLQIHERKNKT